MRKILRITQVEGRVTPEGKKYFRTHAIVEGGDEVIGYGQDFKVGDLVEVFHDDRWDTTKMRKGRDVK